MVARYGIRSTVLPPAAMTMLADDPSVADLAPLRYVRSITAPLSPLQARRFRDKFDVAILNCYGQTEIGGEIVGLDGSGLARVRRVEARRGRATARGASHIRADDVGRAVRAYARAQLERGHEGRAGRPHDA